jgi:hypothetical protein
MFIDDDDDDDDDDFNRFFQCSMQLRLSFRAAKIVYVT